MAFRMTLMLSSGARLSVRSRWPVTWYNTRPRHLNTTMTVSNQYHSFRAGNRQIEPTYMCQHRHTSNATNLMQSTKANQCATYTYMYRPQSGMRQRAYPVLQVYRNYSDATPENSKATDSKSSVAGGSSTTPTGQSGGDTESTAAAQSSSQRIKIILREYGTVAVVFHISMSLCVLSVCYILVSNGLDVDKVLEYFNVESSTTKKGASTFAISYVLYKMLLPVRATVTIACVPIIVRSLRARGWMKGVAKASTK